MEERISEIQAALVADLEKHKEAYELCLQALEQSRPVFYKLEELRRGRGDLSLAGYTQHVSYLDADGQAAIFIYLLGEDSWEAATPFLEGLVDLGFPLDKWKNTEDAKEFSRTYNATTYPVDNNRHIRVSVFLTISLREGNAAGCRRVFIGEDRHTDTYTTPKYKLICNGEETVEVASPDAPQAPADDIPHLT